MISGGRSWYRTAVIAQEGLLVTIDGVRPAAAEDHPAPALLSAVAEAGVSLRGVRYRMRPRAVLELSLGAGAAPQRVVETAGRLGLEATVLDAAAPVDEPGKPDESGVPGWVLTVLHARAHPATLARVLEAALAAGFEVDRMDTLSDRRGWVVAIGLAGTDAHADALKPALPALRTEHGADLVLQPPLPNRRDRRLLIMDVDSTLIRQEVVDELARAAGVYDKVAAITASAMNGELAFEASLRERVGTLKGIPTTVIEAVLARLTVTDGAARLIRAFQARGGWVTVISGGFIQLVEPLRRRLRIDFAFANTLDIRDGHLTGEVVGPIVDRARKAHLLASLARTLGLSLDQTVAIGDGANDLDMLGLAGLGIAFHAKPAVQAVAPVCLNQPGLDAALYLLGLDDRAIDLAIAERPL